MSRQAERVPRVGYMKNPYKYVVGQPEGKTTPKTLA
jgi:hypothetical protein